VNYVIIKNILIILLYDEVDELDDMVDDDDDEPYVFEQKLLHLIHIV